ncbi:MAG: hypothetical protein HYZ89_03405 [Candidatus Omnitrophica bacterium]|nr:hypothetical protein [Candidatus Omnitrophota bacterium]
MPYLIDRQQAFWDRELVAILSIRQRRVRSRVLLRDGSMAPSMTRARAFRRKLKDAHAQVLVCI